MSFLFRFLEPSVYGGRQVRVNYEGEAMTPIGLEQMPPILDPIPPEVVGCARLAAMIAFGEEQSLRSVVSISRSQDAMCYQSG
jgi:hypothetical protein